MAVLDTATFRAAFPAFASETRYPDAAITIYWDLASSFITNSDSPYTILSGTQLQTAMNLLTAHLLTIFTTSSKPVAGGAANTGGSMGGFTQSATIGEVSISKLAPPAKDGWEWWLAGSTYGQALWALLGVLAVGGTDFGGLPERQGFRKVGGVFW